MTDIKSIQSVQDLDEVFSLPSALIFKHSPRCSISAGVRRQFHDFARRNDDMPALFEIDVVNNADVSNMLAEQTGIRHESPQAVLLRNGKAVWDASHWRLSVDSLQQAITME
mgnify:CR=1 FL=1